MWGFEFELRLGFSELFYWGFYCFFLKLIDFISIYFFLMLVEND